MPRSSKVRQDSSRVVDFEQLLNKKCALKSTTYWYSEIAAIVKCVVGILRVSHLRAPLAPAAVDANSLVTVHAVTKRWNTFSAALMIGNAAQS